MFSYLSSPCQSDPESSNMTESDQFTDAGSTTWWGGSVTRDQRVTTSGASDHNEVSNQHNIDGDISPHSADAHNTGRDHIPQCQTITSHFHPKER